MQRVNWMQKLADGVDLSGEPLPGMPIVEIAGECRVLIERHGGVIEYGAERICVRVPYGTVAVNGCGLELVRMTHQQLVIAGRVDSVCIQRRCR